VSKKDPWYRQCKYRTMGPKPRKVGVSWIPEKLAKVGQKVYFGKKAQPVDERELWEVLEVWGRQRESYLVEHQMDYKHQRKQSDV
jgi:hypothetical protein